MEETASTERDDHHDRSLCVCYDQLVDNRAGVTMNIYNSNRKRSGIIAALMALAAKLYAWLILVIAVLCVIAVAVMVFVILRSALRWLQPGQGMNKNKTYRYNTTNEENPDVIIRKFGDGSFTKADSGAMSPAGFTFQFQIGYDIDKKVFQPVMSIGTNYTETADIDGFDLISTDDESAPEDRYAVVTICPGTVEIVDLGYSWDGDPLWDIVYDFTPNVVTIDRASYLNPDSSSTVWKQIAELPDTPTYALRTFTDTDTNRPPGQAFYRIRMSAYAPPTIKTNYPVQSQ